VQIKTKHLEGNSLKFLHDVLGPGMDRQLYMELASNWGLQTQSCKKCIKLRSAAAQWGHLTCLLLVLTLVVCAVLTCSFTLPGYTLATTHSLAQVWVGRRLKPDTAKYGWGERKHHSGSNIFWSGVSRQNMWQTPKYCYCEYSLGTINAIGDEVLGSKGLLRQRYWKCTLNEWVFPQGGEHFWGCGVAWCAFAGGIRV